MNTAIGRGYNKQPTTIRLAISARGHRMHNIWSVWSYRLRRSFLLQSDVALFHWALLESDPTIASYELEAPSLATKVSGETVGTRFDAAVTFRDGSIAWDEVKATLESNDPRHKIQLQAQTQLAAEHGAQYRLFAEANLRPHTTRIWNCLRMLQVLQAAQAFSVARARTSVLSLLASEPATIGTLRRIDQGDEGLNLAAIFGLFLETAIVGDIDSAPLTDRTEVRLAE